MRFAACEPVNCGCLPSLIRAVKKSKQNYPPEARESCFTKRPKARTHPGQKYKYMWEPLPVAWQVHAIGS